MLYPPDIKLLYVLKETQSVPNYYVAVDETTMMVYQVTGYYHLDIETAFNSGTGHPIPLSYGDYYVSMQYLIENGYLTKPHNSPVYQVTHLGWFDRYVRRRKVARMLLTHVLFPSMVAFITTIFTLLLTQPRVNTHGNEPAGHTADQTNTETVEHLPSP